MKIAIIGGAGHIGLPLSLVLAKRNNIFIVDPSENILKIKKKIAPFEDKGIEKYLKNKNIHKNISYSNDISLLKSNFVDVIIIAIGTPLDEWGNPVTAELEKICSKSVNKLKKNGIIILRSTVTPGFSKKIFNNIKKNKKKINIAYCPERIAQGKSFTELFKFAQIVGIENNNKSTFAKVKKIFNKVSPKFFLTDTTTAELVKLFANFWRYSTFAISNQIYMTANQFGCSANEIIKLTGFEPSTKGLSELGGCVANAAANSNYFSNSFAATYGIIPGSFLASKLSGEFKIRMPKNPIRLFQSFGGGLFMGYGAGLAIGCTLGSFFSAIPSMSLSGWLFGLSLAIGAFFGTKIISRI